MLGIGRAGALIGIVGVICLWVSGCSSWGIGGGSGQAARNSTIRWNSDPAAPAGSASGACQPEAQWDADPSQTASQFTPCKGFGSGFFVSERGDILTSAHVVEGCSRLAVRGPSGRVYAARIASTDGAYDLAILKVDGEVPATAVLGVEAPLPSAPIAVVGFPETQASLGGATSGVGQILPPENYTQNRGLIVFNANLARGNSGGPIVDTKGQVVGIVFARYNPAPGVFFGVGSETMRRFLDRHAVGYHMARVSPPAGFDEIIRSAIAYTVYVQCLA